MGKLIKWLLGLTLLIIVLLVTAVIVLPMVINPNDYKAEIVAAVEEKTGRTFAINQDLHLTTFPWLGVETGGVQLGNAPGFGEKSFAQIERLAIRVKVAPLFTRQVEVDTVVLDGLQLNLAKNAQGKTNWADLGAAGKAEQPAAQPTAESHDDAIALLGFMIGGIEIKNTQIHWQDKQTGQDYKIQDVQLLTGQLSPGASTPIKAGFQFKSQKPVLDIKLKLQTEMVSSTDLMTYQLPDFKVNTQAKGDGLPEQGIALALAAQLALDLNKDTLSIQQMTLDGPEVALQGAVDASNLRKQPQIQGQLKLAETNVKQLARLLGIDIITQQAQALTKVSADLQINHDGKILKIDPLNLQLDTSKIQGYVHLVDPQGPVIRSKLAVDQINLDDYLPPAAKTTDKTASAPAQASTKQTLKKVQGNPLAALVPLDIQLETQIGRLVANKAQMQEVLVQLKSKKGLLKIHPFKAKLYEGTFAGEITVDARGKQPKIHTIKKLGNIQIGPLLKDVMEQDRLLGRGDVDVDMRVTGLSEADIRRSLSGTASFRFLDGVVKGVNLAEVVRNAKHVLGKDQQAANADASNQTDFSEMSGSVVVKKGVISNQDLQAKSPLLRISGKGIVNLSEDTIDYRLVTELVSSLEGQGGKGRDELSGVPIPVKVKGALMDPSFSPDLEGLLNAKAKQKIEEEKQKLRAKAEEKVIEKLGEKAGSLLKGLFGN